MLEWSALSILLNTCPALLKEIQNEVPRIKGSDICVVDIIRGEQAASLALSPGAQIKFIHFLEILIQLL